MKIEKIHFNKIKVTFTFEDLIEHNITPEAVRDNAPCVQKVLMNVVRRARDEIGFEANDARLMVEAMPGENDSMVMYITRLDNDDISEVLRSAKKKMRLKIRSASEKNTRACIVFEKFDDAVALAHAAEEYDGGELYFYNGNYCMTVSSEAPWFFAEFGKFYPDDFLCHKVSEHGRLISQTALQTLRENF